jgi:HTH-type transcriptional regulator/antitoxin HigA
MSIAKKLINTLREEIKSSTVKAEESYLKLVELYPLQPITSKEQHLVALKVIEKLVSHINDRTNDDKGIKIYLRTLIELASDFERLTYKSSTVTGREMLIYLMDLQGLTQKDIAKELGGQPVVSKILKGERELNLRQIKALAKRFKVSAQVFI